MVCTEGTNTRVGQVEGVCVSDGVRSIYGSSYYNSNGRNDTNDLQTTNGFGRYLDGSPSISSSQFPQTSPLNSNKNSQYVKVADATGPF